MRTLGLALAFVAAYAWTAAAQVNVEVGKDGVKVDTPNARANAANSKTMHRVSKLTGLTVKNRSNEDLGKIEDLVIDENGAVRYAALSYGGFLGFNGKLFAVPWKALTIKKDAGSDNNYVELNVSKKYLENATGFPSDKWPDFTDPEMTAKWDRFYLRDEAKPSTPAPATRK
jgi:sporulation protein YlmC with PRC-barrel domain